MTNQCKTHHSTVVVGDNLFLWGGQREAGSELSSSKRVSGGSSFVETFNVRSLKWQQKSTTGTPQFGTLRHACVAIDKSIYYFGGNCKPSECFHNSVYELNTEVLHWREVVPDNVDGIPMKRHGCGMVSYKVGDNDHLLLIGGVGPPPLKIDDRSKYATVPSNAKFVYTNEIHTLCLAQSAGRWTVPVVSGSPLPPCAYFMFRQISKTKFVIFGGMESVNGTANQTNNLYLLSLREPGLYIEKVLVSPDVRIEWPRRRISHAGTLIKTVSPYNECTCHLLVLGGLDNDFETTSDCWILDLEKLSWSKVELPDFIAQRFDHSVSSFFVSGQCVWVVTIGGLMEFDSTSVINPAMEFTAMFELNYADKKWSFGNMMMDLNELKQSHSRRGERLLVDRLFEGRRTFQQSLRRDPVKTGEEQKAAKVNLEDQYQKGLSIEDQVQKPFWLVEQEEVQLLAKLVGGGAYGQVTTAIFRGTKVAAKQIYDLIISDYNIQMFTREMDIISKVHHPHIVQFLGATRVKNPILLFELMTTSLHRTLQETPLLQPQILSIASQILSALAYLHLYKPTPIIHRDVSSPNVLLDPSMKGMWKAKLSDFGSANLQSHTKTSFPGNLCYSAPEAENAASHTTAMDVYSLGVIMMEMTIHELPHRTVSERMEQSKGIQWIPVRDIVTNCIAEDFIQRPSALQVLRQLEELEVDV